MSQAAITLAFEQWKAQESVDGKLIVLDEFVFANVPDLDTDKPVDREETLPENKHIVHRQPVNKTGVVNENAVAYSVTLGANTGDFDFNWIGLINKQSNTLAMIVHAPLQSKIKNQDGQQGNVLTRSFLLEYNGAAKETAINTPAEMWQIDFTARLSGMDEQQRLINLDTYGTAAFFGDSFLVKKATQFSVTQGVAYIGGLRAQLTANKTINVPAKATKVWADVSWQGDLLSQWQSKVTFKVAENHQDYLDDAGFAHYVFAIASIDENGIITDLRPKGSLSEQQLIDELEKQKLYFDELIKAHKKSRNHPDATLKEKGFTKLSSATDSDSETEAATPKAVKAIGDQLGEHEKSRNHPDATLKEKGFTKLSSATDSNSETEAATPKAVKTAVDLAQTASEKADKKLDKTSVKGSTGNSTTDVMHQKATTDAINNAVIKNTASKSDHGWWKCASTGIIIQWGRGAGTRNFPIAFPTEVCSITAAVNQSGGDNEIGARITNVSKTSFKVSSGKGKDTYPYYWQAIGF